MKKKTTTKQKSWPDCPEENSFWFNDGQAIRNVAQLPSALKKASPETLNHHVNAETNDFANWVGDVFNEKQFAAELRKAKNKTALLRVVNSQLK
ncbi:MAG: hypothetical protein ABIA37_05610 [Candidatus Woesearchaeota archaeon]